MKKPTYGFKRELQITEYFRNGYRTFDTYMFKVMTLTVLIVDKNGVINEQIIRHFEEKELYKKAGLKKADGFIKQTEWSIPELHGKVYNVSLYAKANGRANNENKFEFPPPVDNVLYFGNCILVNKNDDDEYTNLSKKEWTDIYNFLYGGFDDIGDEDGEEDEDEEDEDENVPRTKSGYVKNDFVVDDEEEDDNDADEEEDEDEDDIDEDMEDEDIADCVDEDGDGDNEYEPVKPVRKSTRLTKKAPAPKKLNKRIVLVNNFIELEHNAQYLECTGELSEEEYI